MERVSGMVDAAIGKDGPSAAAYRQSFTMTKILHGTRELLLPPLLSGQVELKTEAA
jgi:hypothetical protein